MITQYPAKEQAELKVKIKIPGSWPAFKNLTPAERRVLYEVMTCGRGRRALCSESSAAPVRISGLKRAKA